MKKIFFVLAFMLVGTFTFANTEVTKVENDVAVSECCTVTLTHESTGDSVTVRSCRTTTEEACDAAYGMAKAAIGEQ